jgi:uncharacterized membrane protein YkgB
MNIHKLDARLINFFKRTYIPLARMAFFIVFFWFGYLKLAGLSPAEPLAEALIANTVGIEHFDTLYKILGVLECAIGILFLFPKAVRIIIPILFIHMIIVCSPLVFVPDLTWQSFMVPTLEGQYIIKNIVIIALAFGVAANTQPLSKR